MKSLSKSGTTDAQAPGLPEAETPELAKTGQMVSPPTAETLLLELASANPSLSTQINKIRRFQVVELEILRNQSAWQHDEIRKLTAEKAEQVEALEIERKQVADE